MSEERNAEAIELNDEALESVSGGRNRGGRRDISIPSAEGRVCPKCRGVGEFELPGLMGGVTCQDCNGRGRIAD